MTKPLIAALLLVFFMISCSKSRGTFIVNRECDPVIIVNDLTEYSVCNEEILDGYAHGEEIRIVYEINASCGDTTNSVVTNCVGSIYNIVYFGIEVKKVR